MMTRRLLLVGILLTGCGRGDRSATPARSEPSAAQQAAPSVPPDLAEPIRAAERRLAAAPDDPALLFDLGVLHARAGDSAAALALLGRVVAARTGLDPEGTDFDSLRDVAEYRTLLSRIRRDSPPVTTAVEAFAIPEPDLIPEGIAYDSASGRFFLGSIHKRKIVAVSPEGAVTDFVPSGRDGLGMVLGVRVDAGRRLLWAACRFRVRNSRGEEEARSALAAFDLSTGHLAQRILLDSGTHTLNDLVVTRAGDVYVTDWPANEILHLPRGGTQLERIVDSTRVLRPNGIALSPDESRLFVAAWPAIVVVDLRSGAVRPLRSAPSVVTGGLDGLYFHQGSLIGVQNDVHPGRVVRYALSPDLESVERAEVLLSYHPRFEIPTTGAIADGAFYVIANTQLAKRRAGRITVPLDQLNPVVILRVPLR
jgi:sugar lactone lactonase YvrE